MCCAQQRKCLCALPPTQRFERSNHSLRITLQFFFAQCALQCLKGDADKNGVMSREARLALARKISRGAKRVSSAMCRLSRLRQSIASAPFGEDEREVALDRLIARELRRNGLTQRQAIETVEIDFADVDSLPELALLRLGGIELAEPGDGQAIGDGAGSSVRDGAMRG